MWPHSTSKRYGLKLNSSLFSYPLQLSLRRNEKVSGTLFFFGVYVKIYLFGLFLNIEKEKKVFQ